MVYKCIHGLAPQHMSNLFTRNSASGSRSLRNKKTDLKLPQKTFANGQKCFSYRGAKLWNSLPTETKQAPSVNIFKQNILWARGHLLLSGSWPWPPVPMLDCCWIGDGVLFFVSLLSVWRGRVWERGPPWLLGHWRSFPVYWLHWFYQHFCYP